MSNEELMVRLAGIVVLGVGAQWLAWRFRLPSILLLLAIGFAVGPGLEFVEPDELLGDLLVPVVSLSVAVILFEGSLGLRISELSDVGHAVRNLITVGALITLGLSGGAAYLLLDLDASLALLLGAILVVTGPTVILPLLEHVRPSGRVSAVLKWEGITIDPLGAALAVLIFEAILVGEVQEATESVVAGVAKTLAAGVGSGLAAAGVIVLLLRRYWVPDSLHNPVTLVAVLGAHTASNWVQSESGLLAATVMGVALANQRFVSIEHIVEFKENLRVLLIGSLFILLAARLDRSDFDEVGVASLAFLGLLLVVVRPLAVAVSTLRSGLSWRERAFLAWMAPRGIVAASVASIFALRLAEEGQADAERLVPLTFMVIIFTIAVYGLTSVPIARWLGVASPNPQGLLIVGAHTWARRIAKVLQNEGFEVVLLDSNRRNVFQAGVEGLSAYHENVLSEQALDHIEVVGIGNLLALTSNDEVNSLASQRLSGVFGKARVYQLAPRPGPESERDLEQPEAIPLHLRGRLLFGPKVTYSSLDERFKAGGSLEAVPLTDELNYEAFLARYGEGAVPLFLVTPKKELIVMTAEGAPTPRPGQTVIALVNAAEEPSRGAAAGTTSGRE